MWELISAVDPVSPSLWTQIGIGALIAAPAYTVVAVLWRDRGKIEKERRELNAAAIARERELADKMAPILTEAVRILSAAPAQFESALRAAGSSADIDRVLGKLKSVTEDLDRRRE